jgi:hypothetical protein
MPLQRLQLQPSRHDLHHWLTLLLPLLQMRTLLLPNSNTPLPSMVPQPLRMVASSMARITDSTVFLRAASALQPHCGFKKHALLPSLPTLLRPLKRLRSVIVNWTH